MAIIPHAETKLEGWRTARRRAGRMLVALDFDGTLAPIVERPDEAAILPAAADAVRRLARRPDTDVAVVSGRGLNDVRARTGVDNVVYAGNHGMEIEGPDVERRHPEAVAARPRLGVCADALRRELAEEAGTLVEDKGLTLSVHYRSVTDGAARERIRRTVHRVCGAEPGLRLTEGKKVVEVRPDVDWDKGRATRFLLSALQAGRELPVPAVFIGDDRTDEDAFRALRGQGDGVVVAPEPPADTAATAYVRSPAEVAELLSGLAEGEA